LSADKANAAGKIITGTISVTAGVLVAVITSLGFLDRSVTHQQASVKFGEIVHHLEALHATGHPRDGCWTKELQQVEQDLNEAASASPVLPSRFFDYGQRWVDERPQTLKGGRAKPPASEPGFFGRLWRRHTRRGRLAEARARRAQAEGVRMQVLEPFDNQPEMYRIGAVNSSSLPVFAVFGIAAFPGSPGVGGEIHLAQLGPGEAKSQEFALPDKPLTFGTVSWSIKFVDVRGVKWSQNSENDLTSDE
jgi:hypothetical protein